MHELNETHDPTLRRWVSCANAVDTDFPIQNLPLAVFRRKGTNEAWRGGVAIGDRSSISNSPLAAASSPPRRWPQCGPVPATRSTR
jgi:hypothetical protein